MEARRMLASLDRRPKNVRVLSVIVTELELGDVLARLKI